MTAELQRLEDLKKSKTIHMSGIGGSAMNGLAVLLTQNGFQVRGTDPAIDPETKRRLTAHGVEVYSNQDGEAIAQDTQLLITTAALPPEHPELATARRRSIPIVKYAAMLGVVMNSSCGIAVAGTHGKTTTTALTVSALRGAGLDPGFVIGGYVSQFGAGAYGGKDFFVAEACEYDRSFLNLNPQMAVVTNIEADHLDIYSGIDDIIDSFAAFVANIAKDGTLIYCSDSPAATILAERFSGNKISYGMTDADYTPADITNDGNRLSFTVQKNTAPNSSTPIVNVTMSLFGNHNIQNALAACCVGIQAGGDPEKLAEGLGAFKGVQRRFDPIGSVNGINIVDDYAHHPTEIQALLAGARDKYPGARIVVAFQPHQISRTRFFFDDFARSFSMADKVYLPDIYVARDTEAPPDITSENLAKLIRKNGTEAEYTRDFDQTTSRVAAALLPGDLFLTVGAGNIYEVAHSVLSVLSNRH